MDREQLVECLRLSLKLEFPRGVLGGASPPSPVKTYLCILIQNGFIKMQTICMEGKNKEWQSFQVVFEVCWIHRGGGLWKVNKEEQNPSFQFLAQNSDYLTYWHELLCDGSLKRWVGVPFSFINLIHISESESVCVCVCVCPWTPPKLKVAQTRNRYQSKEDHPGKV